MQISPIPSADEECSISVGLDALCAAVDDSMCGLDADSSNLSLDSISLSSSTSSTSVGDKTEEDGNSATEAEDEQTSDSDSGCEQYWISGSAGSCSEYGGKLARRLDDEAGNSANTGGGRSSKGGCGKGESSRALNEGNGTSPTLSDDWS